MRLPEPLDWRPLTLFDQRFRANLEALRQTDADLADRLANLTPKTPYFIAARPDSVFLGRAGASGTIEVIPNPMPPEAARRMAAGLFPNAAAGRSVIVGGLAYGWLWDRIAALPARIDLLPGYRPPQYFLAGDIERLRAVLHLMDWRRMLADPRVLIFAGPDALDQLERRLVADPMLSRPRAAIRVDQSLWTRDIDTFLDSVNRATDARLDEIRRRLLALYPPVAPDVLAQRLHAGRLRVLGVTCKYTTFLRHSMRDWLAGFEAQGHETRLLIESEDHHLLGPFGIAQGVLEYRPDLLVIIDHCRGEFDAVPATLPCAMWVQDRLPNIFSREGGELQRELDYCLGFGRLHLSSRYGYPADRFLSTSVGINERRFDRAPLAASDRERFACDISYVSHASTPAADLVQEHKRGIAAEPIRKICDDLFQRLEALYAAGGTSPGEPSLRRMLNQSMEQCGVLLTDESAAQLTLFFLQSVNNAMFRHQTLLWIADLGLDFHLWGNGWDRHPTLRRFARGSADNQTDLPKIYRASRINIQVTPYGAVHQRLLDGLAAGGFFLLRRHPGDEVGLVYRDLHAWCRERHIADDADLERRADDRVRAMLRRVRELDGGSPESRDFSAFDVMNGHADADFMVSADCIWPEYDQVAFNSRDELAALARRFLSDAGHRERTADSMRQAVIDRCSYAAINRRLLNLMIDDLAAGGRRCAA